MTNVKFYRTVPLPPNLSNVEIKKALDSTESFFDTLVTNNINLAGMVQRNTFSGVVSNVLARKFTENTEYKEFSDQRYPDLKDKTTHTGLDIKMTTTRLKGGEGHNGHSGWHIVTTYQIHKDGRIRFIWAGIAELVGFEFGIAKSDWVYQHSQRNANNSQRTETYVTTKIGTAKIRDGSLYLDPTNVIITPRLQKNREKISELPIPPFSPFYKTLSV